MVNQGLLQELAPADIPPILSGVLFESRGDEKQLPRIPKSIQESVTRILSLWGRLGEVESRYGLSTQKEPDFSMSWSINRWSHGASISTVLRESDLSIGDFVRHVKQIIDLLGQLISADAESAERYRLALESIDRGIIRYATVTA
jgi:ATP-dependent RNA helicase HelY